MQGCCKLQTHMQLGHFETLIQSLFPVPHTSSERGLQRFEHAGFIHTVWESVVAEDPLRAALLV